MFRVPSFYEDTPTFKDAADTMKFRGNGDMLEGMESMNRLWLEHCSNPENEDDDEFYENWSYEVNAYNVVFSGMNKLFGVA
jgi:hypothetical protein|tara:strand:- start:827 stop:1069 length:243 start_codon:yes stop_codon:yes gene_type:complete